MYEIRLTFRKLLNSFLIVTAILSANVMAGGPVGDHVNHLSKNLSTYEKEVNWLLGKLDGMVINYENAGLKPDNTDAIIEHWEAVKFHAAIESNYVLIYASIWQGLFSVKEAMDAKKPIADVKLALNNLSRVLWQGLGAVKMAASFQDKGLLAQVQTREGAPSNAKEALDAIKSQLNKVVAKYAEKLNDTSVKMVAETYLNLFEGVEGELIALDANLVESLEKDFNVVLPNAIKANATVDSVRKIIQSMTSKVDQASALIEASKKTKKAVF